MSYQAWTFIGSMSFHTFLEIEVQSTPPIAYGWSVGTNDQCIIESLTRFSWWQGFSPTSSLLPSWWTTRRFWSSYRHLRLSVITCTAFGEYLLVTMVHRISPNPATPSMMESQETQPLCQISFCWRRMRTRTTVPMDVWLRCCPA